ncbi:MAG: hypothetical protein R3F39_06595 [Myxococcota bacterium]
MIKLEKHALGCDCEHCEAMFPADRFEATWTASEPEGTGHRRALAEVPLGGTRRGLSFIVWLDDHDRLASDWPGFPGTAGAATTVVRGEHGNSDRIVGSPDPILAALSAQVPLRRRFADRINARCMVEHGLAPEDTADFITCPRHGRGLPALTCAHLEAEGRPQDAVILYGVDGDFPDLFCVPCTERYAAGDLDVCIPTCSLCQQERARHHRVVQSSSYGA